MLAKLEPCMIELALIHPEIPPNTGNVSRLAVGLDVPLHLVEPMGFRVDEASVRRAGLDYWPALKLHRHPSLAAFWAATSERRRIFTTAKAHLLHTDFAFEPGDLVLLGCETKGLPEELLAEHPECPRIRIPTWGPVRSLNLSNAAAVIAYEAARQLSAQGRWPPPAERWPDGASIPSPLG